MGAERLPRWPRLAYRRLLIVNEQIDEPAELVSAAEYECPR